MLQGDITLTAIRAMIRCRLLGSELAKTLKLGYESLKVEKDV